MNTTNQAEWFNEGTFYIGNTPTVTGNVRQLRYLVRPHGLHHGALSEREPAHQRE